MAGVLSVAIARLVRCRCGHPRADHGGTLTAWSGRGVSTTACLAGTVTVRAPGHTERVGGDRCPSWRPDLIATLRHAAHRFAEHWIWSGVLVSLLWVVLVAAWVVLR